MKVINATRHANKHSDFYASFANFCARKEMLTMESTVGVFYLRIQFDSITLTPEEICLFLHGTLVFTLESEGLFGWKRGDDWFDIKTDNFVLVME